MSFLYLINIATHAAAAAAAATFLLKLKLTIWENLHLWRYTVFDSGLKLKPIEQHAAL